MAEPWPSQHWHRPGLQVSGSMPVKNVDYGSHMPGVLGLPDKSLGSHLGRTLGNTWVGYRNKHACHAFRTSSRILAVLPTPWLPAASLPQTSVSTMWWDTGSHGLGLICLLFVGLFFPYKSPLSTVVSTLSTIHMDNIHFAFPIQKFSFLLHFCGSVCFLLRVGEYKETFIFLKLFLLFSSPCPLPHVHLRFVARHFHVQIVMILQPYKAK